MLLTEGTLLFWGCRKFVGKRMKNKCYVKYSTKKAGVAVLLYDTVDFKARCITKEKWDIS